MPKKTPQKISLSVSSPILRKQKNFKSSNCLFTQIQPINVEEEKLKFIKSNFSYNPQFKYGSPLNENKLQKFNSSSDQYLPQVRCFFNRCFLKSKLFEGNCYSKRSFKKIWKL